MLLGQADMGSSNMLGNPLMLNESRCIPSTCLCGFGLHLPSPQQATQWTRDLVRETQAREGSEEHHANFGTAASRSCYINNPPCLFPYFFKTKTKNPHRILFWRRKQLEHEHISHGNNNFMKIASVSCSSLHLAGRGAGGRGGVGESSLAPGCPEWTWAVWQATCHLLLSVCRPSKLLFCSVEQ